VPTQYVLRNVTLAAAASDYHWLFLAAGNGIPEHVIGADPGYWLRALTRQLLGDGATIEAAVMEDYIRCFRDPETIACTCADFRSAASADLAHDEETIAAGQKLECPLLVLWGTQGMVDPASNPLSIWQQYASDVRGNALPTGHFVPEEAPGLVSAALRDFLD
jgi:haloacetate dehalogenase